VTLEIKKDCRFFKGEIPCKPHKVYGVHCTDAEGRTCAHYDPIQKRILIIKLGAIGDVIRTTPLLRKLKEVYPSSEIWWLTHTPEILPPSMVDRPLPFDTRSLLAVETTPFDLVYNLDKEREACAVLESVQAAEKRGFGLNPYGECRPLNREAEHRWLIGLFDDLNRKNQKTYQEQIFTICGFEFRGEKYVLEKRLESRFAAHVDRDRIAIGICTGAGSRWQYKKWHQEGFAELIRMLRTRLTESEIVLLGGPDEDETNRYLQSRFPGEVKYFGTMSLPEYIALLDLCTVIVTGDSLPLHLAIGLEKKVVAYFGPTPYSEIELYGMGRIVHADLPCLGCFKQQCDFTTNCMNSITPEQMFQAIQELIS
jgi:heptosyltransferase-2